jgi:GNAT superfamily N-acetyltransferase
MIVRAMLLETLGPVADNRAPLALREVADPTPRAGELLLEVTACGVCHTELDEIEGRTPPPRRGGSVPRLRCHRTRGEGEERPMARRGKPQLTFAPLTPERWRDFTALLGRHGGAGGCWCMWWRQTNRDFAARKGDKKRRAMKRVVDAGREPGILAFAGDQPVGWCAVAPREEYPRLARSRILQPVDDREVWSVVCLYIAREYRRQGVATALLEAAAAHVRRRGGRMIEGYAVEPRKGQMPDLFGFHGLAASYQRAGFREVARRSPTRPIMRRALRPAQRQRAPRPSRGA